MRDAASSAFAHLRSRILSAAPNLALASAAGVVSLATIFLRFRLWTFDLSVPLTYSGDALQFQVLVKALTEGTWNYHIARLGAPFGADAVDFPIGCSLDFAALKLLAVTLHNPFLAINLYWLLSIFLAATFAALLLRYLRISRVASVAFGALFAVIPFVFLRNVAHLNLVTYMVPAGVYIALRIAEPNGWTQREANPTPFRFADVAGLVVICLCLGLAYIYWVFFTCICIVIATFLGVIRDPHLRVPLVAAICIAVLGVAAVMDIAASLRFWHAHGRNTELAYKNPTEADTYGLTIRQMLTPIPDHPLQWMRAIRQKIVLAHFPHDQYEGVTAAQGSIGVTGLFLLICAALAGHRARNRSLFADARLATLASIAVGLILVAEVGGFGSLFNIFVMPDFRAYNRVSAFISVMSLAAVAILFDRVLCGRSVVWQVSAGAALIFWGAVDQIPAVVFASHIAVEQQFREDQLLIADLERRLPQGAMIFQLPHTEFPLDPGIHSMPPYDNAKPYLQSHNLHWSWGGITGRNGNWERATAELPVPQMLKRISAIGFTGILIDRNGYENRTIERELSSALGGQAESDLGTRWVFFDIRQFANQRRKAIAPEEALRREQIAKAPLTFQWGGGFSVAEANAQKRWRWCSNEGILRVRNDSDAHREVVLLMNLQQHSGGEHVLTISSPEGEDRIVLSTSAMPFSEKLSIPPHGVAELRFSFDGPLLNAPGDSRQLAFEVVNFHWKELGDASEVLAEGD